MTIRFRLPVRSLFVTSALALSLAACSKEEQPKPETKPEKVESAAAPSADKPADKPVDKPAETPKATGSKLGEAAGKYKIDGAHSAVVFASKHFGAGYTYGMFTKIDGKYTVDADASKSSIEVEIGADSLFTAVKKRDDHLKGPDFLNTKQFPTITFKSKTVSESGGKLSVNGELTLHGVTKPVTLQMEHTGNATVPMDKSFRSGFRGTVSIKRSDFDMKGMLEAASDDIEMTLSIEGVKE